jgi:hypothetical protein
MKKMLPRFVENCFECPFFDGTTYLGGKCGRLERPSPRVTGYGIPTLCPLQDPDTPDPILITNKGD